MPEDWTDDEIAKLRKWFAEGLSGGQMAARLRGRSRCAVCGKLNRLGLLRRDPATRFRLRSAKRKAPPAAGDATALATPQSSRVDFGARSDVPADRVLRPDDAKRLTVAEIEPGQCRWVHGDPVKDSDWSFCGLPAVQPLPYCRGHCSVVYRDQPLATSEQAEPVSAPIPELQNA